MLSHHLSSFQTWLITKCEKDHDTQTTWAHSQTKQRKRKRSFKKTSGLSKLYLSNFFLGMWEVLFFCVFFLLFLMGQQLQEHFHLPGIYKEEKYLKGQRSNIMEKHFAPEFREEEKKTAGVMEMETIKTSEGRGKKKKDWDQTRKRLMRLDKRCFPFLKTHLLSFSSLSFSLSSPRADLYPACSDGLESVPGKTGHPSPPPSSHPTSISPLAHLPRGKLLPLHLAPRARARETEHYIKQYPHCRAKVLCETTFFLLSFTVDLQRHCFQNEPVYTFDNPNFCLSRCSQRLATIEPALKVKLQMC